MKKFCRKYLYTQTHSVIISKEPITQKTMSCATSARNICGLCNSDSGFVHTQILICLILVCVISINKEHFYCQTLIIQMLNRSKVKILLFFFPGLSVTQITHDSAYV